MPAKLRDLVEYLDRELELTKFDDSSANGLQVAPAGGGAAPVGVVGLAVDACLASFRAAKKRGRQLLIVHHGLIWGGGVKAVKGNIRKRLAFLLANDIALYAAHLPLDAHPRLGNNAGLARLLGVRRPVPFGEYRGRTIGLAGRLPRATTGLGLADLLGRKLGGEPWVRGDANRKLTSVALCSGGGSSLLEEAAEAGYDALITGEGTHTDTHQIADSGFTVIYAGHYETETLGVKAIGTALRKRFGVRTEFLETPH